MPLNNVTFNNTPGGLGRLPNEEDYVSAILLDLSSSPANWTDPVGKKYLSTEEAEADGIVDGDANYGLLWYFIREYFRITGASELFVINAAHTDFDNQKFLAISEGRVRQAFWYKETTFANLGTEVAAIKAVADFMASEHAPLVFITNVKDEAAAVDGAAQPDLRTMSSETVSVIIGGDGSGKGATLATSLGVNYIPAGGTVLGLIARAAVHQSIAWVARFDISVGSDFQKPSLPDGQLVTDIGAAVLSTLNDKGYLFLVKHVGISGSYLNDSHTAIAITSDLATIELNRTMQKAKRKIRSALLPDLNSPLTVDEDGKLAPDTIKYFENKVSAPLLIMQREEELSGSSVTIDPDQDVLANSELVIQVKLQPRGVARNIIVNIGFTVNLEA